MSWENRLTVGDLDDDNGEFENNGGNGEDIATSTDWVKGNTSAEINDEAGSGVTSYNGSDFCVKLHTAVNDYPRIVITGANLDAAFTVGEWYELSFDYKTLNCTKARFSYDSGAGGINEYILLTSITWTTVRQVFELTGNNDMQLRFYSHWDADETGNEVLWIDNISIKPHRKRRIISSGVF